MHNLGLGDLEFDPGHTVDQHRPDGFKVPDIDVEEDNEHTNRINSTDDSIDIQIKEDKDTSKANDGKVQSNADKKRSPNETTPTEYLSGLTWKSDDFEDVSFVSLHNPKHFHHKPHPHGKCFMFFIAQFYDLFQWNITKVGVMNFSYVLSIASLMTESGCKKDLIVLLIKVIIFYFSRNNCRNSKQFHFFIIFLRGYYINKNIKFLLNQVIHLFEA